MLRSEIIAIKRREICLLSNLKKTGRFLEEVHLGYGKLAFKRCAECLAQTLVEEKENAYTDEGEK